LANLEKKTLDQLRNLGGTTVAEYSFEPDEAGKIKMKTDNEDFF